MSRSEKLQYAGFSLGGALCAPTLYPWVLAMILPLEIWYGAVAISAMVGFGLGTVCATCSGHGFSIRSLLVFTLLLTPLCAWYGYRFREARGEANAARLVQAIGGNVYDDNSMRQYENTGLWFSIFGEYFFENITSIELSGTAAANGDLGFVALAPHLTVLYADNTQVDEQGLKSILENCKSLRLVTISRTAITEENALELERRYPNVGISLR